MRCYNGCPDDEYKAYLNEQERLHKELAAVDLRATYFPAEEKWMVFNKKYLPVTEFHSTLSGAVHAALTSHKEKT